MRCLVYLLSTAYDDLATRQEIRHNLWNRPGWDDCVANTGKDVFLWTSFLITGFCVTEIDLQLDLVVRQRCQVKRV